MILPQLLILPRLQLDYVAPFPQKISANRGVSILLEPLLYNNVQANKNIAINYNSINSNVIKTTKTGLNISINTSIPYQDERL